MLHWRPQPGGDATAQHPPPPHHLMQRPANQDAPTPYDSILPADTQLDLLRQTQRRLRTTTDELVPRGRPPLPLGLGGPHAFQQVDTAPPTRQGTPAVRDGAGAPAISPAGPGESFSPLRMPSRVVSGITANRPPQMIPTSARTVSPLQPTFQIPVFGHGQERGQRPGQGEASGQGR
jgi:hypothetical protein